jgi:hypothetical protein
MATMAIERVATALLAEEPDVGVIALRVRLSAASEGEIDLGHDVLRGLGDPRQRPMAGPAVAQHRPRVVDRPRGRAGRVQPARGRSPRPLAAR